MSQGNVVGQNFIQRYILRKNFGKKVLLRWQAFLRNNTKDSFADQRDLFRGKSVRTVFDVGANIGTVTETYASLFPQAQIYSFEASPEIYAILEKNYVGKTTVHTHRYVVTDTDGSIEFNVNYNRGTSSVLEPSQENTWAKKGTKEVIVAPAITLQKFCDEQGIESIDILKLDIEGSELAALQGCVSLLEKGSIQLIYSEVNLRPMYKNQPLLHHITQFLENYGYSLYNIYRIVESPKKQGLFSNAIFLSPKMRETLE